MSAGAVWIYGGKATQLEVTANGTALRSIPGVFRNNTRDRCGRSRGEDKGQKGDGTNGYKSGHRTDPFMSGSYNKDFCFNTKSNGKPLESSE